MGVSGPQNVPFSHGLYAFQTARNAFFRNQGDPTLYVMCSLQMSNLYLSTKLQWISHTALCDDCREVKLLLKFYFGSYALWTYNHGNTENEILSLFSPPNIHISNQLFFLLPPAQGKFQQLFILPAFFPSSL